jgi:DNA-3-methyladenine glycosylase
MKVRHSFYTRTDTVQVARDMLGMVLVHNSGDGVTAGRIVETEAYCGGEDRGCHAYGMKRTPRTEVMFSYGGVAYVYLCYGIHHMFNVVTHSEGEPHAILVRALEPTEGLDLMRKRRKTDKLTALCSGPGKLGMAMGFHTTQSGTSLLGNRIWLEGEPGQVSGNIAEGPRVGMNFDGFYRTVPWNFRLAGSKFIS